MNLDPDSNTIDSRQQFWLWLFADCAGTRLVTCEPVGLPSRWHRFRYSESGNIQGNIHVSTTTAHENAWLRPQASTLRRHIERYMPVNSVTMLASRSLELWYQGRNCA